MASSLATHRPQGVRSPREQTRELPVFKTRIPHDDVRHSLPSIDPISRPSSTSTQHSLHYSASLPQLPGLSALANLASSTRSPQLRYVKVNPLGRLGTGKRLILVPCVIWQLPCKDLDCKRLQISLQQADIDWLDAYKSSIQQEFSWLMLI